MDTELKVYLASIGKDGEELSGVLDDSIYGIEDEFLKPFAGLRYELGVQLFGSELLVRGRLEQDFEAACSRCGKDFDFTVNVPDFTTSIAVDEKIEYIDLTAELRESNGGYGYGFKELKAGKSKVYHLGYWIKSKPTLNSTV